MKSAKHTPAPWTVCTDDVVQIGSDCFIGRLSGPASMGAANARLIAAAPELVDALKATLELLAGFEETHPIDQDIDEGEAPVIKPVCDFARAAIAKAEGRS